MPAGDRAYESSSEPGGRGEELDRMRVWLCPSAYAPHRGGVEELTGKLAQHLLARGYDVHVVTHRHPADLPAQEVLAGTAVTRVPYGLPARRPSSWLVSARDHRRARAALSQLPVPDVVHVICAANQTRALTEYATAHAVPLVLTTQGETAMDSQQVYQRNPWLRRHLRTAATRAAALTACSDWTRRHASGVAAPFASAEVVFNGVDPDDWRVPPPTGRPVFGAWGRPVKEKGFDLLLAAFALVRDRLPEATLLLGGGTDAAGHEGVESLGTLDRDGVRSLLERVTVAVVPSRVEPFGIVALEALAAGRGLVYSSHGGLREAAGACGRAADPFDPPAFAEAMLAEAAAPTPAERGVARARELSWDRIAGRYEDVYARAVR